MTIKLLYQVWSSINLVPNSLILFTSSLPYGLLFQTVIWGCNLILVNFTVLLLKIKYHASYMINKGMNIVRFSTCSCYLVFCCFCSCFSFFFHMGHYFFLINNKWPSLYFWINKLLQILLFYKYIIIVILPLSFFVLQLFIKIRSLQKHGK